MTVAVVVPYRGDDGGPRDRAWAHVQQWYAARYPDWPVVEGAGQPGPWVKASAVADALTRVQADILVVSDADCLSEGVGLAVEAVQSGRARWAMPHYRVYRLSAEATDRVLAGGPLPPAVRGEPVGQRRANQRQSRMRKAPGFDGIHKGATGGGIVVLPRALYDEVPLDPRFVQWGQEDLSWGAGLRVLAGRPARPRRDTDTPIFHLWHDPPPRIYPSDVNGGEAPWGRIDRVHGNPAGMALRARYRAATTPETMRALLAEIPAAVAGTLTA